MAKRQQKKTAKKPKKAVPDKQVETGADERDQNGRWKPGQSGNPNGRPKGLSFTEAIKAELMKMPAGTKMTYLEAAVKKVMTKIVVDGDSRIISKMWDHLDGAPKQKVDLEGGLFLAVDPRPEVKEP